MTARWYTIQVLPNLEKTADFNLRRQGFTPFWPYLLIHKTKTHIIKEPLFKGYGFVKTDIEKDQWRSVNGTRGVVGLLPKWTLMPEPMVEGFVEYFIEQGPIEIKMFNDIIEEFYPGTIVEFTQGLLKGQKGAVTGVRSKLLEIMLNKTKIIVDKSDVFIV